MPILDVDKSGSVIVLKRSCSSGFAGHRQPAVLRPEDRDAVRRREVQRRRDPHRGPGSLRRSLRHGRVGGESQAPRRDRRRDGAGDGGDGRRDADDPRRGPARHAGDHEPDARRRRAARAARRSPEPAHALCSDMAARPPARPAEDARRRRRAPRRRRDGRRAAAGARARPSRRSTAGSSTSATGSAATSTCSSTASAGARTRRSADGDQIDVLPAISGGSA